MFERYRVLILTTLLGATVASSVRGQTAAEFRQRYESIVRASDRVADTLAKLDRARLARLPVDTIHSGALVVLAGRSVSGKARAGVDSAWRVLTRTFGKAANNVSRIVVLLQFADQAEGEIPAGALGASPVPIPNRADVGTIVERIVASTSAAITESADPELKLWVLPYTPALVPDAGRVPLYTELATSAWHAVRECFQGRLDECRYAFGITGTDPVAQWFNAPDRQHYVDEYVPTRLGMLSRNQSCVRERQDAVCIELMRGNPSPVMPPFSARSRQMLLAIALEAGGHQAFDRLLATSGQPLDARLAAAAGISTDSLVATWRRWVLSGRPKTVAADAVAAWAAVFWVVLFSFVALRSTKWR
jgi:hypothetical protein